MPHLYYWPQRQAPLPGTGLVPGTQAPPATPGGRAGPEKNILTLKLLGGGQIVPHLSTQKTIIMIFLIYVGYLFYLDENKL